MRYSTALSGLLKDALNALMTLSFSNPMSIIFLTISSYSEPVTNVDSALSNDTCDDAPGVGSEGWEGVVVAMAEAASVVDSSFFSVDVSSFVVGVVFAVSVEAAGVASVAAAEEGCEVVSCLGASVLGACFGWGWRREISTQLYVYVIVEWRGEVYTKSLTFTMQMWY